MKYLIAMSGGVDSSVALGLTKEAHPTEEICGITLALGERRGDGGFCDSDFDNITSAAMSCERLGIGHRSLYAYPEFAARVIDYFVSEYRAGRTPNPCVICNREIKLGLLLDYAVREGYERVVTGHYARLERLGEYVYIRRAKDLRKDQSYVLAMLGQDQLRCAEFPLGEYTKDEARDYAASIGFDTAKRKDSQDICFIPDGDYVGFITRYSGYIPEAGEYRDSAGAVLGMHRGQIAYTVGQRKGLGISLGRHVFVLGKNGAANEVILGDEGDLYKTRVAVSELNLTSDKTLLDGDRRCEVKLRYAAKPAEAIVHRMSESEAVIEFMSPQRAPTPGQFAVMYDGEYVIGGGIIG